MKKITSVAIALITFLFLASYAENITDNLPKEFFDKADMYAKLEMIENLSILEKTNENDLKLAASEKTNETSVDEANPWKK